ncbi:MAG: hypothetical protein AAF290_03045 [Pseudomonadota bacterium]
MTFMSLVIFVHVLAFVFWLGADVGVYILGKHAQRSTYGVETRMSMLSVAMIIDKFPRVSMVVAVATGYYLSLQQGWLVLPLWLRFAIWGLITVWFIAMMARVRAEQAPHWVERAETVIHYVWLALFVAAIAATVSGAPVVLSSWLFAKLGLLAVIFVMVLWLEKAFLPAVGGFMELAEKGSSPELESRISSAMDTTYRSVIGIYACTLLAALFGVAKPILW